MDDDRFLSLVRRDPRRATELLLGEIGDRVWRLARGVLGADAEDGVQEVFRELHRALPTFRGEARVTTWSYRIAMNTLIDFRNRRDRQAAREMPAEDPAVLDRALVDRFVDEPFTRAGREELNDRVRRAVDALDEIYRTVIVLRTWEGLAYAEIADVLGIPLGTVKSRMAAASVRLAERLQGIVETTT